GELPFQMRVVDIEPLLDELSMILVLGKDDRLPEPVAAGDPQPARHQVLEYLVYRIDVEQPLVNRCSLDLPWNIAILIPLDRVPLLLLILRKFVVFDSFVLKSQGN